MALPLTDPPEGPAVRRGGDTDLRAQVGAQRGGGAHAGAVGHLVEVHGPNGAVSALLAALIGSSAIASPRLQEPSGTSALSISRVLPTRAATTARAGEPIELWFDTDKLQLFDPSSGKNLVSVE